MLEGYVGQKRLTIQGLQIILYVLIRRVFEFLRPQSVKIEVPVFSKCRKSNECQFCLYLIFFSIILL